LEQKRDSISAYTSAEVRAARYCTLYAMHTVHYALCTLYPMHCTNHAPALTIRDTPSLNQELHDAGETKLELEQEVGIGGSTTRILCIHSTHHTLNTPHRWRGVED
jgi:hypothetical protein